MAFFDELGRTISDKSREAAKKAKELTEVMQLKNQINGEKSRITEAYASIGKAYYEEHSGELDERFLDACVAIRNSMTAIETLEARVNMLEGSRICAECGARVDKDAVFCSQCGASMNQVSIMDEED